MLDKTENFTHVCNLRVFEAGIECAKLVEHLLQDSRSSEALRVAERYLNNNASFIELRDAAHYANMTALNQATMIRVLGAEDLYEIAHLSAARAVALATAFNWHYDLPRIKKTVVRAHALFFKAGAIRYAEASGEVIDCSVEKRARNNALRACNGIL